jgi:hypothetical protein
VRAARGSPGRTAERSLRHPGFAHSCILAFALRAALECKAGLFVPGHPLADQLEAGLFGPGHPLADQLEAGLFGPGDLLADQLEAGLSSPGRPMAFKEARAQ